jgi:predicted component of type VI protein secretion system
MAGKVVFRDSQGRDRTVDLSVTETMFIGRGLDCAIRTDDAMVSRKHSQIRVEGGRFIVEDLGSSNGTLVNSGRIKQAVLTHNDVIQCGSLWLRFIDDGVPLAAAAGGAAGPPPKKGGTMRLDAADKPGPRQAPGPTVQPPMASAMGGLAPAPVASAAAVAPAPYGGPRRCRRR